MIEHKEKKKKVANIPELQTILSLTPEAWFLRHATANRLLGVLERRGYSGIELL